MSICTGLVIAVAFHEIDGIPDTKTCTKSNHEYLKEAYYRVETSNKFLL